MLASAVLRTKSPEAFRTISEVAAELDVPQHVLRFWEGRFAQVKPVKRAGGRRYYRPEDVDLLRGIRTLLYGDGFTIKGVQKILRDKGLRHVAELGRSEAASGLAPVMRAFASNVIALERPAEPPAALASAADPVPAPAPSAEPAPSLAEEQRVRLEILLAELQQLKARLKRV
ncbi:MAG: MerR family transcriptional regulator [Rhizomicrobium sp.]